MTTRVQITTGDTDVGWSGIAHLGSNRTMARDSTGRLWVIWEHRRVLDTDGIRAAYSDDNGATWTQEVPLAGVNVGEIMSLVLDSSNVPMILYVDEDSSPKAIRYVDRSGGTWGSPELVYEFSGDPNVHFAAIDSGDTIHIALVNLKDVIYITGSTGSWSGAATAHTDTDFPNVCGVAIDSSDNIYVMFGLNTGNYKMIVNTGSWGSPETIEALATGYVVGSLVIDSSDDVHACYKGGSIGDIRYNKRTSGLWGTAQLIAAADGAGADDIGPPAMAMDSSNNVYIIYQEDQSSADDTIYYKVITGGSGLAGAEKILDSTSTHPNTKNSVYTALWHKYPSSGIIGAARHPMAVILSDDGSFRADLFFLSFAADTVIFPSESITRVTNIIHRYVRANSTFTLEMSLGEVTSDFGLPQWLSRPQPAVAKTEADEFKSVEEAIRNTLGAETEQERRARLLGELGIGVAGVDTGQEERARLLGELGIGVAGEDTGQAERARLLGERRAVTEQEQQTQGRLVTERERIRQLRAQGLSREDINRIIADEFGR